MHGRIGHLRNPGLSKENTWTRARCGDIFEGAHGARVIVGMTAERSPGSDIDVAVDHRIPEGP